MAPFRKGTPNRGLELIFNCAPTEVYLAKMATKAYFRTLPFAPFRSEQLATSVTSRISHRTWIEKLISNQGLDYLKGPLDVVPLYRRWDRNFEVDYTSLHPDNPLRGTPDPRGLNIYTDGSKDENGTGAGVVVLDGGQVSTTPQGTDRKYQYKLGNKTTVFQAEVFAQKMAATLIINGTQGPDAWAGNRPITIHTDSQASILALDRVWIKSQLVEQTLDLLDRAANCCPKLSIRWVKSHIGHLGNELADQAARDGRDDSVAPDWETPLLAKAVMHAEIEKMATRLWEKVWDEVIGCRQTRHFFPKGPRPSFYKQLINLPRIIVGQLIQILTGHTFLNRHQAVIDESERQRIIEANDFDNADDDGNAIIDAPNPKCSRCNNGEETPLHLLTECDDLATTRLQIFGREKLVDPGEIPDFSDLPVFKIVAFFREAKFDTLPMHPFLDQYLPTDKSSNAEDGGMVEAKKASHVEGNKWMTKYLYRIPSDPIKRKKSKEEELDDLTEEEDSDHLDDPIGKNIIKPSYLPTS